MIRFLQTPGQAKKVILSGILLIICVSMVWYLVPSGSSLGFGGPAAGVVATVNGDAISANEVVRVGQSMMQQQFPRGSAMSAQLQPFFNQRAAQSLIEKKLLLNAAHDVGLRVSDEEVREELQKGQFGPYLFPGGNFIGQRQYEDFVDQYFKVTTQQFEQDQKESLLIRKLYALIAGSATVSNADVETEFRKKNTKIKFDYAVLTRETIEKGIHPREEELKAFYERNKAAYKDAIPDKRKIRYAYIDTGKMAESVQLTNADLQSYYSQHAQEYAVPEQVDVRHILIKTPLPAADGKVDEKAVAAAKSRAEDVLKQVKAGGDFAKLAEKYSEDMASGKSGGSLGWIQRGRTVPEFEKAAFSLSKGETSDLIKTTYGFHIIHVDDKQSAHVKPLAEVKNQIEPVLKQQIAARRAEADANKLASAARTGGLEKAAAASGLNVVATDFVSRGDSLPGIGTAPELMSAAFSIKEKAPPELVRTPQGFAVLEVLGVKPPETPTFDAIRARVESEFKNERVSQLLGQKTEELSDRARAAHDLKKAARELGAAVKTSELVAPSGQVPDIGSMSGQAAVAFTLKKGEISGPINTGANGVVLQIVERQEPGDAELAQKKDEIRDELTQAKRQQIFGMYISNLRQQMEKAGKIKINDNEYKALTKGRGAEGL